MERVSYFTRLFSRKVGRFVHKASLFLLKPSVAVPLSLASGGAVAYLIKPWEFLPNLGKLIIDDTQRAEDRELYVL